MAPYSNEYILQYIAKLETGDYTKGLDKIQGKTSSSTGALNKSFSGLSTVIKKVATSKLSLAAAAIYFANKTRLAIKI